MDNPREAERFGAGLRLISGRPSGNVLNRDLPLTPARARPRALLLRLPDAAGHGRQQRVDLRGTMVITVNGRSSSPARTT